MGGTRFVRRILGELRQIRRQFKQAFSFLSTVILLVSTSSSGSTLSDSTSGLPIAHDKGDIITVVTTAAPEASTV
jgi:hypothetical protein